MTYPVLVLNANAQPLSILPRPFSETWEKAIKRMYIGEANVLHNYDDWEVHSPSLTMKVPSVIILKKQVKRKIWNARNNVPTRELIFLRDGYRCQYCGEQFTKNELTFDHVVPRYYGGKTTWNNVSSSCKECNNYKGHDLDILPKTKPFIPTYNDLVKNLMKFPLTIPSIYWNHYLGWDETKLNIVPPQKSELMEYFE